MRYSILVCRAGWLVRKGELTVSHGHATRESAEEWVREQKMIEDRLSAEAEASCAHALGECRPLRLTATTRKGAAWLTN